MRPGIDPDITSKMSKKHLKTFHGKMLKNAPTLTIYPLGHKFEDAFENIPWRKVKKVQSM